MTPLIYPNWPTPLSVRACMTTRINQSNLLNHPDYDNHALDYKRKLIQAYVPYEPVWLNQIHSDQIVELKKAHTQQHTADAAITKIPQLVCTISTSDCLPVLFCDRFGRAVGAAHAGWRGLCAGIVEKTAWAHRQLAECAPNEQMAWLGPAISQTHFEVGEEVRDAFIAAALPNEERVTLDAFIASSNHHKYLCDLYQLAKIRLQRAHLTEIYSTPLCTFSHADYLCSYRRDRVKGGINNMTSMIWLEQTAV